MLTNCSLFNCTTVWTWLFASPAFVWVRSHAHGAYLVQLHSYLERKRTELECLWTVTDHLRGKEACFCLCEMNSLLQHGDFSIELGMPHWTFVFITYKFFTCWEGINLIIWTSSRDVSQTITPANELFSFLWYWCYFLLVFEVAIELHQNETGKSLIIDYW